MASIANELLILSFPCHTVIFIGALARVIVVNRQSHVEKETREPLLVSLRGDIERFGDHLLTALKFLPDVRKFHVRVRVTAPPAKGNSLYPYASPYPTDTHKTSSFFSPDKPTPMPLACSCQQPKPGFITAPRPIPYHLRGENRPHGPGSRATTQSNSREGLHSPVYRPRDRLTTCGGTP